MKKLSKILVVLLMLALTVSTFAIFASAEVGYSKLYSTDFTENSGSTEAGNTYVGFTKGVKTGYDGNKYYQFAVPEGGYAARNPYFSVYTPGSGAVYVKDSSYIGLEFDVSTDSEFIASKKGTAGSLTGEPSYFNVCVEVRGSKNQWPWNSLFRLVSKDGQNLIMSDDLSTVYATLAPTYQWNHISIIIKTGTAGEIYSDSVANVYLDGKLVVSGLTPFKKAAPTDADILQVKGIRMENLRGSTAINNGSINIDNPSLYSYAPGYTGAAASLFDGTGKDLSDTTDTVYTTLTLPKATTVAAQLGDTKYETVEAAIAAANAGDTITLLTNVNGATIDKAVSIDSNGFNFTNANSGDFAVVESQDSDGHTVYTYSVATSKCDVHWLASESDDSEGEVEYYPLGTVPKYNGTIVKQTYQVGDDIYTLSGWALDDISAGAAEIGKIVADDLNSTRYYIPVYSISSHYLKVVAKDGTVTYFDDFAAAVVAAKDGETVVMLKDTTSNTGVTYGEKTVYFDMNGKKLTILGGGTDKTKKSVFTINEGGNIYLYSSVPGAVVYDANRYLDANSVEKVNGGVLFYLTKSGTEGHVGAYGSYSGDNLSVYACSIFDAYGDAKGYIDGGSYYRAVNDYAGFISVRANGHISVKNALISTGGAGFKDPHFNCDGKGGTNDANGNWIGGGTIVVENCKIVCNTATSPVISAISNGSITFKDCDIFGKVAIESNDPVFRFNPTITLVGNNKVAAIDETIVTVDSAATLVKYNGVHSITRYLVKFGTSSNLDFTIRENIADYTFAYATTTDETNITTVIFKDYAGNVLATEKYLVGGNAIYTGTVADKLLNNGIYNAAFSGWDKETKNLTAGEHTFTAEMNGIKAAMTGFKYNLSLYSSFDVNLYIPVNEYITALKISSSADAENLLATAKKVTIGGVEYYVLSRPTSANETALNRNFYITITVNGVESVQTVKTYITTYSKAVLDNANSTTADKQLMMALLAYSQEAYKYFGAAENAEVAAILTDAAYAEYITTAPAYGTAIDTAPLAGALESAQLNLVSTPEFVFTVKAGFTGTVTVTYTNHAGKTVTVTDTFTNGVNADGVAYIKVTTMRAYEVCNTLTVTTEGKIGETAANVSGTYNLDTYAAKVSDTASALVSALYNYAKTAESYKG